MSIFSRLTDIINSNLNALLERARDPEKVIRLIIQEMEDTLVEVRSGAVRFIAERKELDRRVAALDTEAADWESKAELALAKGREDLARGALGAKARAEDSSALARRQLAEIDEALDKQNEDITHLQAKLAEAKAREQALTTRAATATARVRMRNHIYDGRVADAFERMGQMERDLDHLEGRAEAFELGRKATLADQLADLEAEGRIADDLERLKAKVAKS